jgi:uncharacterized protein (DUF427 family)
MMRSRRLELPECRTEPLSANPKEKQMPCAIFDGNAAAASDDVELPVRNANFPPDGSKGVQFRPGGDIVICGWNGTAIRYSIESVQSGGKTAEKAAWADHDP